jgi:catechol 2,3-dioxygenase
MSETATASGSIHPATTLGPATLAVADGERSLAFYRDLLGLKLLDSSDRRLQLGSDGAVLLTLLPQAGLKPRPRHTTGLFHVAILLPSRRDLAQMLRRLIEARHPLGASDHLVSEALYLSDPDANGLEIYRDRPRSEWRYEPDGQIAMTTIELDAPGVLGELETPGDEWRGMPAGTRIGHMHLQVGDLRQAEDFYHGVLGFDVTVRGYSGALFLSAGGYHHHLGLNIWNSRNAPPQPADAAGLRAFTVVLPDAEAMEALARRIAAAGLTTRQEGGALAVDDPWQNTLLLQLPAQGRG